MKNAMRHQRGFLIPLALIIIVGIGSLAVAVSKLVGRTGASSTQEGLSVQAFYAANSGAQYAMNQLFFSVSTRAAADASCTAVNNSTLSYAATGLSHCTADINCTHTVDADDSVSFYRIQSQGDCSVSQLVALRTVIVEARF